MEIVIDTLSMPSKELFNWKRGKSLMLPLILQYMYFENDAVDVLRGGHLENFQMIGIPTCSINRDEYPIDQR